MEGDSWFPSSLCFFYFALVVNHLGKMSLKKHVFNHFSTHLKHYIRKFASFDQVYSKKSRFFSPFLPTVVLPKTTDTKSQSPARWDPISYKWGELAL